MTLVDIKISEEIVMFCKKCGQELPAEAKFCPNCGQEVVQQQTQEFDGTDADSLEKAERLVDEYLLSKQGTPEYSILSNQKDHLIKIMLQSISESALEKVDDEDYFGFHSEHYVDPEWRRYDKYTSPNEHDARVVKKGYTRYCKYKDDFYFIANFNGFLIRSNVKQKNSCAIKLEKKSSFCDWIDYKYIAVNCYGYFLYSTRIITLFGFDGQEIYTHKFGQTNYMECIYIYGDKVYYSETKTTGISSKIYCVNMLKGKQSLVWETQKGDTIFDDGLRNSYKRQWGTELPFFAKPSNIGNVSCEFLYANQKRVVAGYTRRNGQNSISYIINMDMVERKWSILETYIPDDRENAHIFSFNMLDDTMWVKTNGTDIRLIHTSVQKMKKLQGEYSVEWKLCKLSFSNSYGVGGATYYYFDGKSAFLPEMMRLFSIDEQGEMKLIDKHYYQTEAFWYFDDAYIIPNEYGKVCFGNTSYSLNRSQISELIQNVKITQAESGTETESTDTKQFDINDNNKMSLIEFRQKAPSMTGYREELLAYRKSLPDSWDYNAYVGILLGVGGSKHGDAACMNFAIGQGDNGNNTKKTLEARSLMPVFEKYKGKKLDTSIMLSDVEAEIVSIVPEYMRIMQKLHSVMEI